MSEKDKNQICDNCKKLSSRDYGDGANPWCPKLRMFIANPKEYWCTYFENKELLDEDNKISENN